MTTEWTELNTLQDVAQAQKDGWEIEVQTDAGNDKYCPWKAWDGKHWCAHYLFRGRPAKPKMKTVTSECWRNMKDGELRWRDPESDWNFVSDWQRFPAGDFVGEVEDA